jgi:hypothetical protein
MAVTKRREAVVERPEYIHLRATEDERAACRIVARVRKVPHPYTLLRTMSLQAIMQEAARLKTILVEGATE